MKAFISYSHVDEKYVNRLHTHLTQMKRDGIINAWYDREISAGDEINQEIKQNLLDSDIFLAITSPDFLASRYCYEEEMSKAIEMHKKGKIRIIPIIIEPCDWLNSPLKEFSATPRDGKPVSEWSNPNTAFLEIITALRKIVTTETPTGSRKASSLDLKNTKQPAFRTKRDFDKIDVIEFKKNAFQEISQKIAVWCLEANRVEGIKALHEKVDERRFYVTLVNQNKSNSTCERTIYLSDNTFTGTGLINVLNNRSESSSSNNGGFSVEADDYHLFLQQVLYFSSSQKGKLSPIHAAHEIWNEMMQSVGIEYAN